MPKSTRPSFADDFDSMESRRDTAPHLIIEARAGTGKTTTLIEGLKVLKGLPVSIKPSPQQQAIWDALSLSRNKVNTICFVAFNKSIAEELKRRVPPGCDASTMHAMGFKAVGRAFKLNQPGAVNADRVNDIIEEILGTNIRNLRINQPILVKAVRELVDLCKMNLVGWASPGSGVQGLTQDIDMDEALVDLADYYDIDLNHSKAKILSLVPQILERCKDVNKDGCIDYADMIWIPVVHNLPVFRYDMLLVDEAQDLNRCQQTLAKMAGSRLILCGDPKQAIYGFAGADSESMNRMEEELGALNDDICIAPEDPQRRGCDKLMLTVTRRCGKAIVEEARRYVSDFEAHEGNPTGEILDAPYSDRNGPSYRDQVLDGDMVLCRCNNPLVSQCFKFLKAGRRAHIQGRDIGQGLISTIKKIMKKEGLANDDEAADLIEPLEDWATEQGRKERARKNPNESKLAAIQDRVACLMCFIDSSSDIYSLINKIEEIFTDNKTVAGIRLSSIHKAKGLESDNVFILMPEGATMPMSHPKASAWQREQEINILYVAITRAIHCLTFVS